MTKRLEDGPHRVSGKLVLLVLALLGAAAVVLAVTLVRPPPGFKPAAEEGRAYGPATSSEQRDIPLIQRKTPDAN